MHIGARLKKVRKIKNLSQTKVCANLISPSHYSNVEGGRYEPSKELLETLAERMSVPKSYFLYTENDSPETGNFLDKYEEVLDNDITTANKMLEENESLVKYIPSIQQEIHFMLLNCLHLIKESEFDSAKDAYENVLIYVQTDNHKLLSKKSKFLYYFITALLCFYDNKYNEAILNYNNALVNTMSVFEKGKVYYNIALCFYRLNDIRKAINYVLKSNKIYTELDKWLKVTETNILLGILYADIAEYENAKDILEQGLEIAINHKQDYYVAKILHNLGNNALTSKDYTSALEYFNKSLKKKKDADIPDLFITHFAIIYALLRMEKRDGIEEKIKEAEKTVQNKGEKYQLLATKAELNHQLENFEEYEKMMSKSLDYFVNHGMWINVETHAKKLAKYFYEQRKYKKAFYYLEIEMKALEYLYKDRA